MKFVIFGQVHYLLETPLRRVHLLHHLLFYKVVLHGAEQDGRLGPDRLEDAVDVLLVVVVLAGRVELIKPRIYVSWGIFAVASPLADIAALEDGEGLGRKAARGDCLLRLL